ncbi:MAG: hypothetical protein U9N55_09065 [candidate division Zixibacteria bacterium]|nr:hypothetical protein [candidate division Zixibacteria bacterium]
MRKFMPFIVLLSVGLYLGCGGDDGGDNGTNHNDTTPRLTVNTTVTDYLLDDALASAWDSVDSITVDVSCGNPPAKLIPSTAQAITSNVMVKAVNRSDSLYLWLRWTDATFSVWPSAYTITDTTPSLTISSSPESGQEDQMYVMFDGAPDGGWDVWNWRVLTTGAGGLAEGMTWNNDTLITDANGTGANLKVEFENSNCNYCHKDTCEFNGYVLLMDDAIKNGDPVWWKSTHGWEIGQKIPGFRIDTSLTAPYRNDEIRGSRWDTRAVSDYDSTVTEYTLVLCRKMNTGFTEDIDFTSVDSVKVQLGVLDEQHLFTTGSNYRGFSEEFWIIF